MKDIKVMEPEIKLPEDSGDERFAVESDLSKALKILLGITEDTAVNTNVQTKSIKRAEIPEIILKAQQLREQLDTIIGE